MENINAGDHVQFTATVVNAGDRAVPAGTTIGIQFQIDGNTSVITWCDNYSGGLQPGARVNLTANGGNSGNYWNATAGSHTVTAWVDDVNRLPNEVNEGNNMKTVSFAVGNGGNQGGGSQQPDLGYTPVTGGYDLVVTGISYDKTTIHQGDQVRFSATVVNAGDTAIPAGTVIGVQFQVDGNTGVITWCDSYSSGLQPGQSVTLTANGGNNGSHWYAVYGNHTVMAWVDDVNRLPGEVNEGNNQKTISINVQ